MPTPLIPPPPSWDNLDNVHGVNMISHTCPARTNSPTVNQQQQPVQTEGSHPDPRQGTSTVTAPHTFSYTGSADHLYQSQEIEEWWTGIDSSWTESLPVEGSGQNYQELTIWDYAMTHPQFQQGQQEAEVDFDTDQFIRTPGPRRNRASTSLRMEGKGLSNIRIRIWSKCRKSGLSGIAKE